jgi:hypothetical protein
MSVHFEAPMLLITQCPDRSRWYAKHVGTVVPYRGHDDLSGFLSAEEGGYSNYVRSEDAHVVQAQFGPMDAQRWPYADVPRRAIVTVQRRGVAQAKPNTCIGSELYPVTQSDFCRVFAAVGIWIDRKRLCLWAV